MRIATPDIDEDSATFYKIVRLGQWEPFGYYANPDNPYYLDPNPKELLLLEQAKLHLKNRFSLRDVAKWLSNESGRSITHQGLKTRVASDQKRNKQIINARFLLQQLTEAWVTAKRIESRRMGVKDPTKAELKDIVLAALDIEED